MAKQITFTMVGGQYVEVTPRGKNYVEKRGYAEPPGTGPSGETCKTCKHIERHRYAKTYLKCGQARHKHTGGPASDILAGSPACRLWEGK